jgi:predicted outer membrane protein
MVTDHAATSNTLSSIAAQDGVPLPTSLDATRQAELSALQSLTDGEFFPTYVSNQVPDHTQVLMQFVAEAQKGQDQTLVAYAKDAISALAQDLQGVLDLQQTNLE